jgi:hypothetical protein
MTGQETHLHSPPPKKSVENRTSKSIYPTPLHSNTYRKLTQPVTIWQSITTLKDWLYFWSANEDRLYRKYDSNSWKIYTYHGGAIRNRQYKLTNLTCSTKPPTATWLTSVSPRLAPTNNPDLLVVAIECYTGWQYKPPDEDLTSYNPTEGQFSCIHDAFDY